MKKRVFFSFGWQLLIILGSGAAAEGRSPHPGLTDENWPTRSERGSWAVGMENDVFAAADGDKDYTFGLNLTYSGPGAGDFRLNPLPIQRRLDRWLGVPGSGDRDPAERLNLEFGIYGFTPDDIMLAEPILDDRPYASLVYLESTWERVNPTSGISWTSSFSLGLLGLDAVGSSQNAYHEFTGKNPARGWRHQISDGGELTAKYQLARQHYWDVHNPKLDVKTTASASVGYITELSYGIGFRYGKLHSGWWSFDPDLATYGENSIPTAGTTRVPESYFWAGALVKARAYNVFLQGQFRDSAHTFDDDELRHLLVEGWLGYTHGLGNGYRISYVLRGHSSEIRGGQGDRHLVWGGLIVSKTF